LLRKPAVSAESFAERDEVSTIVDTFSRERESHSFEHGFLLACASIQISVLLP